MGDMKGEESIRILITGGTIDKGYDPFTGELTPLLHKDVVESTACPHQKAVSTFLPPAQRASWPGGRITSKGHSWIDPGDDIDLTAIPLWVRV
jgi:hypothetical protein